MHLESLAYSLPLWACIAVALVPPMTVVLIVRFLARSRTGDGEPGNAKQKLIGMLTTAFVFSVTFSTNTVWSQDSQVYTSANQVVQTGLAILDEVEYVAPSQVGEGEQLFTAVIQSLPSDINELTLKASPESKQAMRDFRDWSLNLDVTDSEQDIVTSLMSTMNGDWRAWLVSLNGPGVPDVIFLMIVFLGLLLVGTVAYSPLGANAKSEFASVFMFGLVVGMIQIPLWVLNSEGFVNVMASNVFDEFGAQPVSFFRLGFGLVVLVVISAAFYGLLKIVMRRHQGASPAGSETLSAEV